MMRMREHIHRLHCHDLIHIIKESQVARLGRRVATHIDHTLGSGTLDNLQHALIDTCAGRIEDDDIGATIALDKLIAHHILHVTCIERRIVYAVEHRVQLGILDSLSIPSEQTLHLREFARNLMGRKK